MLRTFPYYIFSPDKVSAIIIMPIYRWGHRGAERLNNLPNVSWGVRGDTGRKNQSVYI